MIRVDQDPQVKRTTVQHSYAWDNPIISVKLEWRPSEQKVPFHPPGPAYDAHLSFWSAIEVMLIFCPSSMQT
jgi:hypothetical protein